MEVVTYKYYRFGERWVEEKRQNLDDAMRRAFYGIEFDEALPIEITVGEKVYNRHAIEEYFDEKGWRD